MQTAYALDRAESQFLGGLPLAEAQRLLQVSQVREYRAGEVIYRAGEAQRQVLLLLDGAAKISVAPGPLILDIVLPGEVFGGISLNDQEQADEHAEALGRAVVRSFELEDLLGASANGDRNATVSRLLSIYAHRTAHARKQWTLTVVEDVPQRVGRRLLELLRQSPEAPGMTPVPVRLRQEDLAYMVGSTRTTVSEILNDFERRGLVELKRASFRVDRDRLRQALWVK